MNLQADNITLFSVKNRGFLVALSFFIMVYLFYGSAAHLWWTHDDTQILKQALQYKPWQYFFVPGIWQELSPSNLTPFVTLSYDIDIALFGLTPRYFYIHQLISLSLCCIMLYYVLNLWVPPEIAFVGVSIFLVGVPVALSAQQLMIRHYIEGFLLSLLSLYLFIQGIRRHSLLLIFFSAFIYMGATAAKEIYVPLALLLPAIPEGQLKTRFTYCLPFFAVFSLYVCWRWWMLGTLAGGYGAEWNIGNTPELLIAYLNKILVALFNIRTGKDVFIPCIVLLLSAGFLIQERRAAVFSIYAGALTILPIFTIPPFFFDSRHVFLVWGMISIVLSFALLRLWSMKACGRIIGILLISLIIAGVSFKAKVLWNNNIELYKQIESEGRFFLLEAKEQDILRNPLEAPWYFEGLSWLKRYYYGVVRDNAKYFYDDIFLCDESVDKKYIWNYSPQVKRVENITRSVPALREAYCNKVRQNVPLKIRLAYASSRLSWEFGPYKNGNYSFIICGGAGRFDLPSSGKLKIQLSGDMLGRVRYESPEGWITYSPPLRLGGAQQPANTIWERN